MNKEEMAIKYLEESKCNQKKGYSYQEQHNFVLDMAIQALKKQIPQKPMLMQYADVEYMCEECGMKYWEEGGVKYCTGCGQKLEW